jgi:hypothetical protein
LRARTKLTLSALLLVSPAVQACSALDRSAEQDLVARSPTDSVLLEGQAVIENDAGYIVLIAGNPDWRCVDVRANDGDIGRQLADLAEKSAAYGLPASDSKPRFRVELRANPAIALYGDEYAVVDSKLIVSSSPSYLVGSTQTFLNCPDKDLNWTVYDVLSVEPLG